MIHVEPQIHGKVQKKGILELNLWWNQSGEFYFNNLTETVKNQGLDVIDAKLYHNGEIPKKYPIHLPMAAPCQVFFNHKHKIIYMKNPKTGSGTVSTMLKKGCWDDLSETGQKLGYKCYDVPKTADIPDAQTAEKMWKEYFIVATVRNPYGRAASMYTYLLKRRVELNRHTKEGCKSPSFLQFSQAPFVLGIQSNKYQCIERKIHDYHHVESQTQCLINKNGELTVDFVISVENMERDWKLFLKEYAQKIVGLNQTKNNEYFQRVKGIDLLHKNEVAAERSYASDVFQSCGQDCVENINNHYNNDFEILGYKKC
eukprot:TRINITY_DN38493_c0_g1_i1.p1 TRINITY_DN38493_c0_g1~~TRINITY_DN38493_c0_g1_i1.p1  ORF type:complete len:359 (+),score=35.24 TRINITY_DN38493_c0_g1_i1:137-1078(+)